MSHFKILVTCPPLKAEGRGMSMEEAVAYALEPVPDTDARRVGNP